jgi:alkanesulfonate monooxygenase SsuD/methylene tetrahydromethanopterin reductase-like flavin-dependent oxidoreductase (luciferase family)
MNFGLWSGPRVGRGGDNGAPGDARAEWMRFADEVVEAEQLGYYSTFVVEHHFTGFSQVSSSLGLLAYLAGRTTQIRLGTAVTVLPWHNPVHLVEQANTVDLLSGGRLDLGVGRGYRQSEFDGFGIPIEQAQERFDEALEVLLKAWGTKDRWSHAGKRWTYTDVIAEPEPVQEPHPPIWIASGSRKGIESAAERGFNLLLDPYATFDQIAERVSWYRHKQAELETAILPYTVAVARPVYLVSDDAERDRVLSRRQNLVGAVARLAAGQGAPQGTLAAGIMGTTRETMEDGALVGDARECAERVERLRSDGVDYVLLAAESAHELRGFARDVMPVVLAEQPSTL